MSKKKEELIGQKTFDLCVTMKDWLSLARGGKKSCGHKLVYRSKGTKVWLDYSPKSDAVDFIEKKPEEPLWDFRSFEYKVVETE